ncbi:MAG TPA: hypothetical protein VGB37_15485 [Candidatus Lokiarchaeia archaeon]
MKKKIIKKIIIGSKERLLMEILNILAVDFPEIRFIAYPKRVKIPPKIIDYVGRV